MRVAIDLSDQGRVALGNQIGPGVARIEGKLVEANGDGYVIGVSRIETIGGQGSQWTGERVRVQQTYVARVQERRLSKKRTLLAAATAAAAVGTFIVTRNLLGIGRASDNGGQPPSGEQ
jgi:hypothetical protein